MADKVRYSISVTPIEEVTEHYGYAGEDVDVLTDNTTRTTEVIATHVQETLGCSSQDISLVTNFGTMTNSTNGFASGSAYYLSAPANTAGLAMPALASCDVLYIENTGYQQSSSSATKGTTANTTDYLTVEAGDNGTILAILKANELKGSLTEGFLSISSSVSGLIPVIASISNGDGNISITISNIA